MLVKRTEELSLSAVIASSPNEGDRPYPVHELLMEEFNQKAFLFQYVYHHLTQKPEAPRTA